jgi:hypothetical protein
VLPLGADGIRATYKYQSWASTSGKWVSKSAGPLRRREEIEHTCAEAHELLADGWRLFKDRFYRAEL